MNLKEFFIEHGQIALAFSGGVDSALLLYVAKKYGKRVKAYYVKTAFQPEFEFLDAKKLADLLGVEMKVIELDILKDERVQENPGDRCYYCKKQIFSAILEAAKADGFMELMDGTNASDEAGDRPGMRVLSELHVYSPLRLCGMTKDMVREASREAGLFTWDKPAYACLATRIPTGTRIEESDLKRTEFAEGYLHSLGFVDFRIRLRGDMALIQIRASQLSLFVEKREQIFEGLKAYYGEICLDLKMR